MLLITGTDSSIRLENYTKKDVWYFFKEICTLDFNGYLSQMVFRQKRVFDHQIKERRKEK